ncbi:DUF2254 domain-containing protein [Corallococcus macrosporus]|uniref:DUF2254 domain-containing protein n=1 Tax=Myxococcus fulvus (strain ATCC BAA-855 / HW-1) TaxID=483219 RepID=F8CCY9_MYXFH|nr:DUF2254 domain-containing protein [Corallococcus macrosporus]AEI64705.1 hypothetical protein LILAB_14000 [Corallococcus macrosporus]
MAGIQARSRVAMGHGVPRDGPPRDAAPIRWWLRHRVWLSPVVGAVVGACLGVVFVSRPVFAASVLLGVAWQATATEARDMLFTVLGIALTSLSIVLSLSMLVVQNVSEQFTPRLLRHFVRGAGIRVVIPVFVATSVFCLVAAHEFGLVAGAGRAPRPALGLAMVLLIACEGALVFQVLHTIQTMRVENIVQQVRMDTLRVAHRMERLRSADVQAPARALAPTGEAWPLRAPHNGFVVSVDARALLGVATARRLVVHLERAIGEPVIQGTAVGWFAPEDHLAPASCEETEAVLLRALRTNRWRDEDVDVALGVRQLVDVAIKALSPGINDPYTAVEALDQLIFLMCELSRMRLGPRVVPDASGKPRVFLHAPSLRDYLDLITDQTLRYGDSEPTVVIRLLRLAGAVGQCARSADARQAALGTLHRILAATERKQQDASWLGSIRRYAELMAQALEGRPLPPLPAIGF